MKNRFKKIYYRLAYLDTTGECKKEETYFYRFPKEIGENNLRMMRSMSVFMLIISFFVIASTFTYFAEKSLRYIYIPIMLFEIILLFLIYWFMKRGFSTKACTILTSLHLFHMLALGGFIGIYYCMEETAIIFVVVLTISSIIFTLPTIITTFIASLCTIGMIIASFLFKDSYWFESDTLNGISVLIFSILFGWRINQIRAEEAFARSDAQRLNLELKKISVTDPLTGLFNHRSFQDSYYQMFHRASSLEIPLGIIMMDLDKFKAYNDNYGHVAGDVCLGKVASAIHASIPECAIACRYGGEEFIVLLNEELCSNIEMIGEDIRKAVMDLEISHSYASLPLNIVTLSLGAYAGIPQKGEPPMDFVELADKAMYQSKENGRNRLTVRK